MQPMELVLGSEELRDFEKATGLEWLATNGLGGYASSTVIGCNTRRYHGLLVAALNPPLGRTLLLSRIEEEALIGKKIFPLATNQYPSAIHPQGYLHQSGFSLHPFPSFTYEFDSARLEKQVIMHYGHNAVLVRYRLLKSARSVTFYARPLVSCRDFHGGVRHSDWPFAQSVDARGRLEIEAYPSAPILSLIWSPNGSYSAEPSWYHNFEYEQERRRGLNWRENHYNPGYFKATLTEGDEFWVYAAAGPTPRAPDPEAVAAESLAHWRDAAATVPAGIDDPLIASLALAADQFIVHRRSTNAKTIIAGYHWFNDWGRDTMIALPGLCLATGRFAEAREILKTFAIYARDGLLPNTFPDGADEPYYNSVDAALWLFWTVHKYLQYTADYEFVFQHMLDAMESIVRNFAAGTLHNIHMDDDGLIWAGDQGTQLTWMDARVGDWVVTSRHGKPVEVNALWHNALMVYRHLAARSGRDWPFGDLIRKVADSFNSLFWNLRRDCLYDVVAEEPDPSLRCNQIVAVAMPFSMLDPERQRLVVDAVYQRLWTPFGLRSLAPGEPGYQGWYGGDQFQRDGAYHQGTVWVWPLGQFITAYAKTHSGEPGLGQWMAENFLDPFRRHLVEAGLGSVSEIFDGDEPNAAKGCIAQAWSVAAVLRSFIEDVKGVRPPYEREVDADTLEAAL